MITYMKKIYQTPDIRIQLIDSEDNILDTSLPLFDEANPKTIETETIENSSEVLGNGNSVWDQE